MEHFVISRKIPLEKARKDVDWSTGEEYDPDNPSGFSEWAFAFAIARWNIGDKISAKELQEALMDAKMKQTLDDLVEAGYISSTWDTESEEECYFMTEEQAEAWHRSQK
jgi:hypothetical protein